MTRQLTHSGLILPVIRKVICRDDAFVCSICRTEYSSKVDANNCLNHCWFDIQDLYPVVLRKINGRRVVFRCHFCCRDYKDESEALSCARRCQNDRNNLHVREQLINDLPIEAPTQRPSRIRLVAMKLPPSKPVKSRPIEESTEMVDEQLHVETETSEQEAVENLSEQAPPRRTKADFPKQWVRMDAKYQCRYCNALFYTKMEVEACFNNHFDEEGFEKMGA